MQLHRGMPVIVNDIDAPQGGLVAILESFDFVDGVWEARYLSKNTSMTRCVATGLLGTPTPLSRFGVEIRWLDAETYEVTPIDGASPSATYEDGRPRRWQEARPVAYAARPKARALLLEAM